MKHSVSPGPPVIIMTMMMMIMKMMMMITVDICNSKITFVEQKSVQSTKNML